MSTSKFFNKPLIQTQKSSKLSQFAPQCKSPDSYQKMRSTIIMSIAANNSTYKINIPVLEKTERAKTLNFSETEQSPPLKKWEAVGKIDKLISLLRKTKGQRDFTFQTSVADSIQQLMKLSLVDEKAEKLKQQILQEKEQKLQSQAQTLKFIKHQQEQIDQLKRRCADYLQ